MLHYVVSPFSSLEAEGCIAPGGGDRLGGRAVGMKHESDVSSLTDV